MSFYTYVVNSSLKLNDWLNNEPGNDYTHVYIAPGRWVLDYDRAPEPSSEWNPIEYPLLSTIGTKTITGAPGSVICDDGYEGILYNGLQLFAYNTLQFSNYIRGITIELNHIETYYSPAIFLKCANVSDCTIISLCSYSDASQHSIRGGDTVFSECINVHDNFIKFGTTSTYVGQYGNFAIFQKCRNISNCMVEYFQDSDGVNINSDDGYNYIFESCLNIYNVILFTQSSDAKIQLNGLISFSDGRSVNFLHVINGADIVYTDQWGENMTLSTNGLNMYECTARKSFGQSELGISHCTGLQKYYSVPILPYPRPIKIYSGGVLNSGTDASQAGHTFWSQSGLPTDAALDVAAGGYNNMEVWVES